MSKPSWSNVNQRYLGDKGEILDVHSVYKDQDDRYWSFFYDDAGGEWAGPHLWPVRSDDLAESVESKACDCGGAKARTTHSSWCSAGGDK